MFTSRLFTFGLGRAPLLAAGISTTVVFAPLLQQQYRSRTLQRLDTSPSNVSPKDWSFSEYSNEAQTPIITSQGRFNARSVRQLSAGSIIGLVAGLGVSVFSKPLALLIGLLIAGVQTAESYGIHLVPYKSAQKYFKSIDLRNAVQDNIAFKISFGLMFALSAFAELPQ